MPFPSEETTPPVTKTNLVIRRSRKLRILPEQPRLGQRDGVRDGRYSCSPAFILERVASRPNNASTASIAGVSRVPVAIIRSAIMICGGLRPCFVAPLFNTAPIDSRDHGNAANVP